MDASKNRFLVALAAADIPIPTIEDSQQQRSVAAGDLITTNPASVASIGLLTPNRKILSFSTTPRTPMPALPVLDTMQRPNWHDGAVPQEDRRVRSASVASDISVSSDDSSCYSSFSHGSDFGDCASPDSEYSDPFSLPSSLRVPTKGKGRSPLESTSFPSRNSFNAKLRVKADKSVSWTMAMDEHLQITLMQYIQDPTVTPIRLGPNCMPPDGVCHRVAREAKRSWNQKGSAVNRAFLNWIPKDDNDIGVGQAHALWPHSLPATRSHLRELCRRNGNSLARNRYLQSRSPSPFAREEDITPCAGKTPLQVAATPCGARTVSDLAVSLAISTSDTMNVDGPLAALAVEDQLESPSLGKFGRLNFDSIDSENKDATVRSTRSTRRATILGSPAFANTYGPSESKDLSRPAICSFRSQPGTLRAARPQLASPFKPKSFASASELRHQMDLDDDLTSNVNVLRPTILDEQLYGTPFKSQARRIRNRGFSLKDEAPPRFPFAQIAAAAGRPNLTTPHENEEMPALLPVAKFDAPPRLGSPFRNDTCAGANQTFPRRMQLEKTSTLRRAGYTSMHQSRRSIESFDFGEGLSLYSRLRQAQMHHRVVENRKKKNVRED